LGFPNPASAGFRMSIHGYTVLFEGLRPFVPLFVTASGGKIQAIRYADDR